MRLDQFQTEPVPGNKIDDDLWPNTFEFLFAAETEKNAEASKTEPEIGASPIKGPWHFTRARYNLTRDRIASKIWLETRHSATTQFSRKY